MTEFSAHLPPRSEIFRLSEVPTPDQTARAKEDAYGIAQALDEFAGSGSQTGVLEQLRKDPQLKDDSHLAQEFLQALSHVKAALKQVEDDRDANPPKITQGQARDIIGDQHFAGLTGPFTNFCDASVGGLRLHDIMDHVGTPDAAKEYLGGLFHAENTPTPWFTMKMSDMRDMSDGLKNYKG